MTILDASTVMLLREHGQGVEVFMVKRQPTMAFMANAFVYPGGKLDAADKAADMLDHVVGVEPAELSELLRVSCGRHAVGLYLAAIRETFEEAGVLLARRRDESDWVNLVGEDAARFGQYRQALNVGELSLAEVARLEDLVFPLKELGFLAHWITPPISEHRFDTRFFVARLPAHQEPVHDTYENTESLWIKPEDAIQRSELSDEFYVSPPTERTLSQLARLGSADAVFDYVKGRRPPRVMSHLDLSTGTPILLFPGDPDFPDDASYAHLEPLDDDVTRMVLKLPRSPKD